MKPIGVLVELRQRMLADHQRLDALFVSVQRAFDTNATDGLQGLWVELEYGLERHFVAEERWLFPRFGSLDPLEIDRLKADHVLLRRQLHELGVAVHLNLVRREVAKSFLEQLHAHAARENAAIYRWADEAMAAEAEEVVDALLR